MNPFTLWTHEMLSQGTILPKAHAYKHATRCLWIILNGRHEIVPGLQFTTGFYSGFIYLSGKCCKMGRRAA